MISRGLTHHPRIRPLRLDDADRSGGIHGRGHALRGKVHAAEIGLPQRQREAVHHAALWHDIYRIDGANYYMERNWQYTLSVLHLGTMIGKTISNVTSSAKVGTSSAFGAVRKLNRHTGRSPMSNTIGSEGIGAINWPSLRVNTLNGSMLR